MEPKKLKPEDVIKNIKSILRNEQKDKIKAKFIKTSFICLGVFVGLVVIVGIVLRYFFPKALTEDVSIAFLVCIGVAIISIVLILLVSDVYANLKMKRFPVFETGSKEVKEHLKKTIADGEEKLTEVKEFLELLYEIEAYFPKEH